MNPGFTDRNQPRRGSMIVLALLMGTALAGCQTSPTGELAPIDVAQGSEQNIASLSSVIQRNPQDPEAFNVRGSAYGRGGRYQECFSILERADKTMGWYPM